MNEFVLHANVYVLNALYQVKAASPTKFYPCDILKGIIMGEENQHDCTRQELEWVEQTATVWEKYRGVMEVFYPSIVVMFLCFYIYMYIHICVCA